MHGRKLFTTGTVATLAILALVNGCQEATTGPTTVNPQDFAANLKLLSGNQQVGIVGAALPELLSVKVVDAGGQPVPGATVLWQVRNGGGTISPAASTTGSSGVAAVTWTLGTGLVANKAVAILQGGYVLDSAVFTASAKVGPAQQFTLVSGNSQSARVTTALSQPLVVSVKDLYGHPVSGTRVTWAAGLFSGTVTAVTDTTDASGSASATWTLGTAAAAQSASATITGLTPIAFAATATADTSRVITVLAGNAQSAAAGAVLSTTLQVSVADRFSNPIAGENVIFNDSISAGGSVSPTLVLTDAAGRASATWTLGNLLGTQVARARVGAVRASFSATATATFAQAYAGNYFTCGVTTGDRAFCWGFGEDGQRGIGATKSSSAPGAPVTTADTMAGPFTTWRQIGAGSSYICGISIARQMYCWGRLASALQVNVPTLKVFSSSVLSFAGVSTSETHSCAITTDGVVGCTGSNARGQLGDGSHTDVAGDYAVVTTVAPDARMPFSSVVTGGSHSCAFPRFNPATAADSLNTLRPWCWGANGSGQLGNATVSIDSAIPRGINMTGQTMVWDTTSLAAGSAHTCALTRTGSAYCWGANGYGQLGGGSALVRDSVPMAVAGGLVFAKLYAGEYHTCGITTTGSAYCWGRNSAGQLGTGNTTDANLPMAVGGGLTWRSLALGELHTCGVASATGASSGTQAGAGVVYCWGDNEYGQLGTGTVGANGVPVTSPVKVKGQP